MAAPAPKEGGAARHHVAVTSAAPATMIAATPAAAPETAPGIAGGGCRLGSATIATSVFASASDTSPTRRTFPFVSSWVLATRVRGQVTGARLMTVSDIV